METSVAGLRLDKDGGTWVHTDLPESSKSRIDRTANLKLSSETGGLEGKLTLTFTGLEAMRRRTEERNADETERKTFLENEVKEFIPAASEVELTKQPDWKSSDPSLVAEFDVKIPGWASSAGHRALLPVGLFSQTEKHLFEHANRTHPLYFEFPFQRIDDVTIELPPNWQVSSVPKSLTQGANPVAYNLKVDANKDKLHWSRILNVDLLGLETKYYPAVRNFFQIVRTGDEEQIVLQPGPAIASN
jgi:hypothetical protein